MQGSNPVARSGAKERTPEQRSTSDVPRDCTCRQVGLTGSGRSQCDCALARIEGEGASCGLGGYGIVKSRVVQYPTVKVQTPIGEAIVRVGGCIADSQCSTNRDKHRASAPTRPWHSEGSRSVDSERSLIGVNVLPGKDIRSREIPCSATHFREGKDTVCKIARNGDGG